jgi:hypothetical protein
MVNSQVVAEIANALKIDQSVERVPLPIPVVEVGVKNNKNGFNASNSLTNGTSATIIAAPADQDLYITGATLSVIRDNAAVYGLVSIKYYPISGVQTILLSFGALATTANTLVTAVTPPMHPILIKRGTAITLVADNGTGNFKATGQIYGFLDELS